MQNLGSIQSVCACMAALMQGGLGGRSSRPEASRGLPDPEAAGPASATAPGDDAANGHSTEAVDQPAAERGLESAAAGQAVLLPLRVSVRPGMTSLVGRKACLHALPACPVSNRTARPKEQWTCRRTLRPARSPRIATVVLASSHAGGPCRVCLVLSKHQQFSVRPRMASLVGRLACMLCLLVQSATVSHTSWSSGPAEGSSAQPGLHA